MAFQKSSHSIQCKFYLKTKLSGEMVLENARPKRVLKVYCLLFLLQKPKENGEPGPCNYVSRDETPRLAPLVCPLQSSPRKNFLFALVIKVSMHSLRGNLLGCGFEGSGYYQEENMFTG